MDVEMTRGAADPEQQRLMEAWKPFIAPPGEETLRFSAAAAQRLRTALRAEIESVLAERSEAIRIANSDDTGATSSEYARLATRDTRLPTAKPGEEITLFNVSLLNELQADITRSIASAMAAPPIRRFGVARRVCTGVLRWIRSF
ncbi:hypothetical protein WK39_26560 [Burkholderia cepacia]|nr:hypothetical protein WK39_26560 [Burkholderia cepacia]KVS54356.1 hypothetical protein WK40_31815 [Burkholderia cepacia]